MVSCVPGLEARLTRRAIPDNVTDQKLWVLETRDSHSNEWKNGYCFGETEFLPQDFASLNFRTMRDPNSWFTSIFILTKVILDETTNKNENQKGCWNSNYAR
jgi:arylamine N-acetyltransferase